MFCHQTPGTRDGVNTEFDKCSFFQRASFSQPACARALPRDSSTARSSSSPLQLLQPRAWLKRSPKLAQLPPRPAPGLPCTPWCPAEQWEWQHSRANSHRSRAQPPLNYRNGSKSLSVLQLLLFIKKKKSCTCPSVF